VICLGAKSCGRILLKAHLFSLQPTTYIIHFLIWSASWIGYWEMCNIKRGNVFKRKDFLWERGVRVRVARANKSRIVCLVFFFYLSTLAHLFSVTEFKISQVLFSPRPTQLRLLMGVCFWIKMCIFKWKRPGSL